MILSAKKYSNKRSTRLNRPSNSATSRSAKAESSQSLRLSSWEREETLLFPIWWILWLKSGWATSSCLKSMEKFISEKKDIPLKKSWSSSKKLKSMSHNITSKNSKPNGSLTNKIRNYLKSCYLFTLNLFCKLKKPSSCVILRDKIQKRKKSTPRAKIGRASCRERV